MEAQPSSRSHHVVRGTWFSSLCVQRVHKRRLGFLSRVYHVCIYLAHHHQKVIPSAHAESPSFRPMRSMHNTFSVSPALPPSLFISCARIHTQERETDRQTQRERERERERGGWKEVFLMDTRMHRCTEILTSAEEALRVRLFCFDQAFLRSSLSTSHKSPVASLPVLAFGVRLFRLDQYISTHARTHTCTHPCTHGRDTSRPTHAHTGVGGDVDNEHGRDCLPGASGAGRNGFNGSEPGRRPCILTRTRGEHRRVHVRRYAPQQHHGRRTALVRFALV